MAFLINLVCDWINRFFVCVFSSFAINWVYFFENESSYSVKYLQALMGLPISSMSCEKSCFDCSIEMRLQLVAVDFCLKKVVMKLEFEWARMCFVNRALRNRLCNAKKIFTTVETNIEKPRAFSKTLSVVDPMVEARRCLKQFKTYLLKPLGSN